MLYLRFFGAPVVRLDDQSLPALARSPLLTRLLAFLVTYRDRLHACFVPAALLADPDRDSGSMRVAHPAF